MIRRQSQNFLPSLLTFIHSMARPDRSRSREKVATSMTPRQATHRDEVSYRWGLSIVAAATVVAVAGVLTLSPVNETSAATVGYDLGTASTYAWLAGSALTVGAGNTLSGTAGTDIGISPGAALTAVEADMAGHGAINVANSASAQAQADAQKAYTALISATPVTLIPGELGGSTFAPGIYTPNVPAAAITMTTSFTLDGGGDPNAVWVFTTEAAASTAASITMNLINGAQAANVYWAVGAAFTTGASANIAGHFIAKAAVTLGASTIVNGQLIALAAAPMTIPATTKLVNSPSSLAPATVWLGDTLGAMRAGYAYDDALTVTSSVDETLAPTAATYSVSAGSLPAGISLDTVTGKLSGIPLESSVVTWTIKAQIVGHSSVSKSFTVTVLPGKQPFVDLGSATRYAIIGASNITIVGSSTVSGDAGTAIGTAVGPVAGATNLRGVESTDVNNAAYVAAHNDLVAAIAYANGLKATTIPATLAGLTLTPGVYENTAAIGFTGNFTLDAVGNPNGIFIIRTPAALVSAAAATVTLVNGAQACNVFWVVGAAVTLGANNDFSGHILAAQGVDLGADTAVHGQLLTTNKAVVLANNDTIINNSCTPSGNLNFDGGSSVITADETPTISGTSDAESGSVVTVTVGGQILTTTVSDSGNWSVTPTTLSGTVFTVLAVVRNLAGANQAASQTLTLDTTAPILTISGGATAITGERTPIISGTSDAIGRAVTIIADGTTSTTTVAADGTWSVETESLTEGSRVLSASVADASGNTAIVLQVLTVDLTAPAVTINGDATATTGIAVPKISGIADAIGSTVTVTIAGQTLTTVVDTDGTWSVAPTTLAAGTYTVTVNVSDVAGNIGSASQTLTVDTTLPILTINGAYITETADSTPTISGTSDAIGSPITIAIDAGTSDAQSLRVTVRSNGTWSVTAGALTEGTHTIEAAVTNALGHASTTTQLLTIDLTGPSNRITGGASDITGDSAPAIAGTSDAIGRLVTVGTGGQTWTTVVTADGTWTVTPAGLAEGINAMWVSVSDAAGNSTTTVQELTVDWTAPVATINGGAIATSGDTTPTISGTSDEIGSTIIVVVDDQTLRAIVSLLGSWSVDTTTLSSGAHTVIATIIDRAGNTTVAAQKLSINIEVPVVNIDNDSADTTTDPTPTITGTGTTPGGTVTVTIGGQTVTSTVNADGTWSVTARNIELGMYMVEATVTAPNGQDVIAYQLLDYLDAHTFTLNNTTQSQTVRTGLRDSIVVSGNGFAQGEQVEIWLHSTPVLLGMLTADASGSISGTVSDAHATPDGTHHIVLVGARSGTSAHSMPVRSLESPLSQTIASFAAFPAQWLAALLTLLGVVALLSIVIRHRTKAALSPER
jgi:hypothetical protein